MTSPRESSTARQALDAIAVPAFAHRNSDAPAPVVEDFVPGLESAFPREFEERDYNVRAIGLVPDFVHGTYYLNGPARFGSGDLAYRHWLDGDGMVSALRFSREEIHLTQRYIRSRKYEEEHAAGRPLFRTFGTDFPGSRLNRVNNGLESPVNVSVFPFAGRILAFGEQGLPWELDPHTLETRGQFDFGGRLNDASPFSAHPKFDPASGEMFNFGIFFSTHAPRLYFYCFGAEGIRYRKAIPLEYPCTVHDFSLSKNYAVFFLSPYLLNVSSFLNHGKCIFDSLHWEPERGSRLVVVSRTSGEPIASIPAGNRYCLHLINSFEEGDRLIVDVLEFDEPLYPQYSPVPNLFTTVSRGGPVRFVVDLQSRAIMERRFLEYTKAPDFPAIDSRLAMRSYVDFWMLGMSAAGCAGRKFFDQLVHASWTDRALADTYQSPALRYLGGEPLFVGGSDATEGIVICQEYDAAARQSSFLVFDAARVAKGPVARIPTEGSLYFGFHSCFVPAG